MRRRRQAWSERKSGVGGRRNRFENFGKEEKPTWPGAISTNEARVYEGLGGTIRVRLYRAIRASAGELAEISRASTMPLLSLGTGARQLLELPRQPARRQTSFLTTLRNFLTGGPPIFVPFVDDTMTQT